MAIGNHYGNCLNTAENIAWADKAAEFLIIEAEKRNKIPLLAYMGMSGVSKATALAVTLMVRGQKFELAYVRKDEEKSHGCPIEVSGKMVNWMDEILTEKHFPVFVDDFVSSGRTFRCVMEKLILHKGEWPTKEWIAILGRASYGFKEVNASLGTIIETDFDTMREYTESTHRTTVRKKHVKKES